MMTIAMYHRGRTVRSLASRSAGPAGADRRGAVRFRLCAAARPDQSVHHPARAHAVLLLVALAIIIVNVLLIVFGPDARTVQTSYAYDSFQIGPLIVDAAKVYAGAAAIVVRCGAVRVLPLHAARQGDPRLRRQSYRRAGGRARCQAALRAHFRARRRLRRRRRHHDGADHRRHADARAGLYAARLRHRHHRRPRLDAGRAARRRADRRYRGGGRAAVHAVRQEHVRLRHPRAGAAVPAAGPARQEAAHDRAPRLPACRAARRRCCCAVLLAACSWPRRGSSTIICSPSSSSFCISPISVRPGTS